MNDNEGYGWIRPTELIPSVVAQLSQYIQNTIRRCFDTTRVDFYIGSAKHYVDQFIGLYSRNNILCRGYPVNQQDIVNNAVAMLEDFFRHSLIANTNQVFVPNEHNIMTFGGALIFLDMEAVYPIILNNIMHVNEVVKTLEIILRHEMGHVCVNKKMVVNLSVRDYDALMSGLYAERVARMNAVDRISDPSIRLKKYSEMPEEVWADKAGLVTPEEREFVNRTLSHLEQSAIIMTKMDDKQQKLT